MRHEAIYNTHPNVKSIDDGLGAFDENGNSVTINEVKVAEEIKRLQSAEPMRLLRIERTRLLTETDWEVTRGIEEGIDITELKAYRSALRNLPQEIEAGNIEAPTLNENGELVFNSWPVRG